MHVPPSWRTFQMQNTTGTQRLLELQRYNEKLARLCHLTADIARLGEERSTLKKIVDTAATLLGVEGAHLALVDKDEQALYGVVSSGRHPQGAPRLKFQLSQSAAAQQALKRRLPIAIDNAEDDARVNPRARDLMGIRGIAYVPLLSGTESFGLLILITRRPHTWTQEELDLAAHLANVSAVALENSRLMTQLAETERRLRSLIEHVPAIIYICDVEPPYRTLYISPQTMEMLGYAPEEWLNDSNGLFMKIIHPDDLDALVDLTREDARTKGFSTVEYRLLDRQGETRWFRDEAVLVRDLSGAPIAWHGVLIEITGSKKMQDH
jgi:PAS domain S-box-containing protein